MVPLPTIRSETHSGKKYHGVLPASFDTPIYLTYLDNILCKKNDKKECVAPLKMQYQNNKSFVLRDALTMIVIHYFRGSRAPKA